MKVLASLILVSSGAVLLGQASPEPVTPWATGSAAVTLAGVVGWLLTKTLPSMQRDFRETLDKMAERHDQWEKSRHDDSEKLNGTLREMSSTCARVHEIAKRDDPE